MAAEPRPLQIYLFASSTCPECMEVKENLLPRLQQVYGDRIKVTHQVLDDIENFKLLLLYEKKYGATDDEPLRIFLGDAFLSGKQAIEQKLEKTIAEQLQKGAVTPTPEAIRAEAKRARP
jgi:predicted DsbA family dithiol-disulfide isomerase